MGRWLLAPRWVGLHVLVLLAVVVTAGLGWWQWDVSRQRHAASQQMAPAGPPVPLADVLVGTAVDPGQTGRLVTLSGRFDPAHQLLVPGHKMGGRDGFWVATPLRPASGPAVMVVRGWAPAGAAGSTPTVPPAATGQVSVTGWVAPGDPMPSASTAVPPAGQVAALNAALLVNLLPYPVLDGYLNQTVSVPAGASGLTAVPRPALRSGGSWPLQNLAYVLQWWIFGAAAVWFWVLSVRNEAASRAQRAVEAAMAARSESTTRCSA